MQKCKFIAAIILLILGILALLFGIFGRSASKELSALTDASIGQTITVEMAEPLPIDEHNYLLYYQNGEDFLELRAVVSDEHAGKFKRMVETRVPVTGIVQKTTAEMDAQSYEALLAYYENLAELTEGLEITDDIKSALHSSILPYCLEVTAIDAGWFPTLKRIAFVTGCILLLAGVIVLVSLVSGLAIWRICLILLIALVTPVLIAGIFLSDKIRSVCSIRKDGDGVYYMDYAGSCQLDEMLQANLTSDEELIAWIRKTEFYNLPIEIQIENRGCASFKAQSPEGNILFGRNFDYPETDTLMVYSKPKNGYASYAMADLRELGIRKAEDGYDPDTLPGRCVMLGASYVVCDGINEAGLGVSTLQLDIGELHQDNGKPDLYIYTAPRLLLDRCATVDEAVELLGNYDIHSHNGTRQHLFLVDQTGHSAVIEWSEEQMYVNELDACTNSVLTPGRLYDKGADRRLPAILLTLSEHNGVLTPNQVKELLAAVSQKDYTEWSCVYDLNNFSVDVYTDEDFGHAYHYGPNQELP